MAIVRKCDHCLDGEESSILISISVAERTDVSFDACSPACARELFERKLVDALGQAEVKAAQIAAWKASVEEENQHVHE